MLGVQTVFTLFLPYNGISFPKMFVALISVFVHTCVQFVFLSPGPVLGVEGSAQLRSAVPARGYVVGPEDGGGLVVERGTGQAKVADLELAVRVGQDVLGLEVTVEDLGCGGQGREDREVSRGGGDRELERVPLAVAALGVCPSCPATSESCPTAYILNYLSVCTSFHTGSVLHHLTVPHSICTSLPDCAPQHLYFITRVNVLHAAQHLYLIT